ncbi:hypothetical protein RRF57_011265 [Xylaria bambusicola]|uniref:Uncharacterized protein n=1 Tax=Xylaria bambusicola TaxID=326684 RepID=A0AAN7UXU2_9PEZI
MEKFWELFEPSTNRDAVNLADSIVTEKLSEHLPPQKPRCSSQSHSLGFVPWRLVLVIYFDTCDMSRNFCFLEQIVYS